MSDKFLEFRVSVVRPDMRQFRQQAIELFPVKEIHVRIPISGMLDSNEKVDTINLAVLREIADQFDIEFLDKKDVSDDNWDEGETEDDEWDEEVIKPDEISLFTSGESVWHDDFE